MRIDIPVLHGHQADHIVFRDRTWDFYESVLRDYDEAPTRVNFDGSTLEIMTLSIEHEAFKEFIGRMIGEIAMEFQVAMRSRGSTTLQLRSIEKGLEADQCFWIQHQAAVRDVRRLDLTIHPPPDLVVEVDITHAVVDRESIYASLGVPEMWHFDNRTTLSAWKLVDGVWDRVEHSVALPMIRVAELNVFLERIPLEDDTTVLTDFRAWLRTLPR
ncbi:MAG TPA: Uma2 family endonuclease [Tepidisphaeraceae bacterium]|jgi:Uma2 family endonuclease|nr:Uma2 family endonuclease [Tepidisphaeraceae bacterium]